MIDMVALARNPDAGNLYAALCLLADQIGLTNHEIEGMIRAGANLASAETPGAPFPADAFVARRKEFNPTTIVYAIKRIGLDISCAHDCVHASR